MKPTKEEVDAEIAALNALKPIGPWASTTAGLIGIAAQVLSGEFNSVTAADHGSFTQEQLDIASSAQSWLDGRSTDRPSQGWGELVAP